jgi:hypothetical protein
VGEFLSGLSGVAGFTFLNIMENSKEYISELMKHCDPYSILVVGTQGQLIRLFCPFNVVVVLPVGYLVKGDVYYVDAVKVTLELRDVYIIQGKAYYIVHFKVII